MGRKHIHRPLHASYAGLDFIKAAFCPLEFNATRLGEHPQFRHLKKDEALARLEVGTALHYPRQFSYTDRNGNRKTGTQIVTAPFGLAPADFDLLLGLYTYLKKLPEIPADGALHLTADFLARQLRLPATSQKDYLRLRSRIFRFSYAKYTNTAIWDPATKTYNIANFGFYNLLSLSRIAESRRPISFQWDRTFLDLAVRGAALAFDYEFYRSLSPALRRLYLIANRDGWNQRESGLFVADDFAIHQIGYSENPELARRRLQKLRALLSDAEQLDIIRPFAPWKGYLHPLEHGPRKGKLGLRWSRGPALRVRDNERHAATKKNHLSDESLEDDALYAQVRELRDERGAPIDPLAYRRLLAQYGRDRLQKHVVVILAQKESQPGSFQRSEVAAFVDRLQHDYPLPDWYQDLTRAERLSPFHEVQPNQLSMEAYSTFFTD